MNVPLLMVAFLLHLHSDGKLNIRLANHSKDNTEAQHRVVKQWCDYHQGDLYVYA